MTDLETVLDLCLQRHQGEPGARRLFHGRGHCYPGLEFLCVDWFFPYIMITQFGDGYSSTWIDELARLLHQSLKGVAGVQLQVRNGRATHYRNLIGQLPQTHVIQEAGLRYQIDFARNQNIGFFLDMSPARNWLRSRAQGKKVLNLFAFTCAFSVAAIAGGARQVVNNDMSRSVLARGRENHELNSQNLSRVSFLPHNLFRSWGKLRQLGRYELIVIDPPTNQRGSFVAEKDYGTVLKRISQLAHPGAEILACLNSPFLPFSFLQQQMARRCPDCRLLERLPVAEAFEERHPDRGLKLGVFRYDP